MLFDYFVVENEVDITSSLQGMKRKIFDEIYEQYAKYGFALGFNIHKSTIRTLRALIPFWFLEKEK